MILRGHFFSKTLEMETGISVLVPNGASRLGPRRVAYLLHGLCGRSGDWLDYTRLPVYAERYDIAFVMPEVARSFYSDMALGQAYYSYVVDELPRVMGEVLNIPADRDGTMIMGASMGGYGALKCALSRPDRYGYCAAVSSACLFLREGLDRQRDGANREGLERTYGVRLLNDFEAIFGPGLAWKPEYEIMELAARARAGASWPALFTACGTDDYLYGENARLERELNALGYEHGHEEWKGAHDWDFFDAALERALRYFND